MRVRPPGSRLATSGPALQWDTPLIIIIVLAATGWLTSARLMRGMVLSLRNQTFTEAAKAMDYDAAKLQVRIANGYCFKTADGRLVDGTMSRACLAAPWRQG